MQYSKCNKLPKKVQIRVYIMYDTLTVLMPDACHLSGALFRNEAFTAAAIVSYTNTQM